MIYCTLTIAGSDPTGGAGIQADLKVFSAWGVFGLSVLTSLTAQNSSGIKEVYPVPPFFIDSQLGALINDFRIRAVKIGMLYQKGTIKEVSKCLKIYGLKNLVLDPIARASSGGVLIEKGGMELLKKELLPLVDLVTPNLEETELLIGKRVDDINTMKDAAYRLYHMGAKNVLIKGGHLAGEIKDIFFNGKNYLVTDMVRDKKQIRGTGCTLSAAIVAGLAKGLSMQEAVSRAQKYTQMVIQKAIDFGIGPFYPDHYPLRASKGPYFS